MLYNYGMPVQTQKEPTRINPFEQSEEPKQSKPQKKPAKKKEVKPLRPVQIAIGIFACAASLITGRYLRHNSTLFLEHRTLDGYLPVEEYVLNYSDTGQPTQNVRSLHLDTYRAYGVNSGYETSRGIETGDSWEDFVEAYGDETVYSVYCYRYKEDGYIDWDYDRPYFDGTFTVRQFDEKYVQTGVIDPTQDGIDLEFCVETDGIKLMYSDSEKNNFYHSYSRSHLSSYPDTKRIYLEFEFKPEIATGEPGLMLDSLSSSTY